MSGLFGLGSVALAVSLTACGSSPASPAAGAPSPATKPPSSAPKTSPTAEPSPTSSYDYRNASESLIDHTPMSITIPDGPGPVNGPAPIYTASLLADGELQMEHTGKEVAWIMGVSPGDPGVVALAGHRDTRNEGKGLFYNLSYMEPGDEITVETLDGKNHVYVMDELKNYGKADLSETGVFKKTGKKRLALITCGGEYDHEAKAYPENLVVWASPKV